MWGDDDPSAAASQGYPVSHADQHLLTSISTVRRLAQTQVATRRDATLLSPSCRSQASLGYWREPTAPTAFWQPCPLPQLWPTTRRLGRMTGRMRRALGPVPAVRRADWPL